MLTFVDLSLTQSTAEADGNVTRLSFAGIVLNTSILYDSNRRRTYESQAEKQRNPPEPPRNTNAKA